MSPEVKAKKFEKIRKAFADWNTFTTSVRNFMGTSRWSEFFKFIPIQYHDIKHIINSPLASESGINVQHLKNWRDWLYTNRF